MCIEACAMTPDDCLRFLSARLPDGCALPIIGFTGDPYTVERTAWSARAWTPALPAIRKDAALNLFVGISAFAPEDGPVLPGRFLPRRKDTFVCTAAIMIDDLGTGPGAKMPMDKLALEPTWLVETSPDNYQAWYALDEPCADADLVAGFLDAMVKDGLQAKADPGMSGVSRVGRLPGGVNGKAKYAGFRTRITRAGMARVSLDQLAAAYRIDPARHVRERKAIDLPAGLVAATPTAATVVRVLDIEGLITGHPNKQGWIPVECPWRDSHTDRVDSGSAYMLPRAENNFLGGFQCHHGHCINRTVGDLLRWTDAHLNQWRLNRGN